MSWRVNPFSARSAMISPTTLANLKPCPEQGEAIGDLRVVGVQVDDEVVVRGVGEHAGLQVHRRAAAVGEVSFGEAPEQLLVVVVGLAVDLVGIAGLARGGGTCRT